MTVKEKTRIYPLLTHHCIETDLFLSLQIKLAAYGTYATGLAIPCYHHMLCGPPLTFMHCPPDCTSS